MWAYTSKRLFLMLPTLLVVATAIFFLLRVVPGDIVELKLLGDGGMVSQATIDQERARLGLDQPLLVQYFNWMVGLVTFDFGTSMWTGRAVSEEIAGRLMLSIELAILASIVGLALGIVLGTLSALLRNTWVDHLIRLLTLGGMALPSFWIGMLIILFLLYIFDWLPPMTYTPFFTDPWTNLSQLIWPALAVGYRYAAVVARLVRSSIMEVMNEDYIRTARAKGVYERLIIVRHAMRNALLPVVTLSGLEFAFLIGGLVVTEQVFNLNGIGKLFIDAIDNSDYVLIQSVVMLMAFIFIVVNLIVDLLYAALDPRIRY